MPSDLRDRLSSAVLIGPGGARYLVRELLGEGGQGWVFKATTEDAREPAVVVKVLRPDVAKADVLPRFEREVSVLRALSSGPSPHPNIVRFLDHGRAKVPSEGGSIDISFLVMELIEGPPLRRVLHAHGGFGLPVARVRRVLRGVARALGDMHAQGIVHRDLKPSNILLAQQDGAEVAKVTDFGLVKLLDASVHQTVTMAGASAGYAPPEQYEVGNRRVGPATDVFAFAAILYEALSGCEAFPVTPGETALQIVAKMLGGDRPALARVSATIPRELRDRGELTVALDREIARATDGDPSRRHASIDELWSAVAPILRAASSPSSAGKPSEPPPLTPNAERLGREPPPRSAVQPRGDKRASNPDGPSARVVGKPMTGERLRSGAFSPDGGSLVAIGAYGMYRFASGVWSALRAPRGVDARSLRGMVRAPSGELLLYGDGCAVLAAKDGGSTRVDPGDADVTWLGALADDRGVCLVGERRSRPVGVVAILPTGGAPTSRDLDGTSRLHAAARLGAGQLLVVGTHGALLVIDGDDVRPVAWGRTGHLYAAVSTPDGGAFAVGSGGHALAIAAPPSTPHVAPPATLEAVQTTRDLLGVAVDPLGVAWAVGGQGRLLMRRDGTWTRVPIEIGAANLIAIACRETPRALSGVDGPRQREVITLAEDGAVVEVRLGE